MIRIPTPPRSIRFARFGIGAALLIWMSLEDNSVFTPVLLASLTVALVIVERAWRIWSAHTYTAGSFFLRVVLNGLGFGAGSACAAAALMFFKNAWHAHAVWDYPPALVVDMLFRVPVWSIAGMLIGVGVGALITAMTTSTVQNREH